MPAIPLCLGPMEIWLDNNFLWTEKRPPEELLCLDMLLTEKLFQVKLLFFECTIHILRHKKIKSGTSLLGMNLFVK